MLEVALLLVEPLMPDKVKGDNQVKKGKPDPPSCGWDMGLAIPPHKDVLSRRHCTLDAGLLARSQYPEGPATGHIDTGFSWFPCVYKQMLRWFPRFQVATTCFSCSPPDLNLEVTNFMFCLHVK